MITVVGEHAGREAVRFVLAHGADPAGELALRGWAAGTVRAEGSLGDLLLRYDVDARPPGEPATFGDGSPVDGIAEPDRSTVRRRQRVAAYAVVVERGALLLTRLALRTSAPGEWTLPGGGIDPGEEPVAAVVREVIEETGQVVSQLRLLEVMTQHRVGVSGRGPEDHHAVRLLHSARCTRPTRPVVNDVGGSTTEARWVPLGEVAGYPVVPTVPVALAAAGYGWAHPGAQS